MLYGKFYLRAQLESDVVIKAQLEEDRKKGIEVRERTGRYVGYGSFRNYMDVVEEERQTKVAALLTRQPTK
ncbi:MAG: hypothetical protein LBC61_06025 [Candidatus Peribacteria bacterium]|nr:hypothetical protein [Candidatus Peribacteria bacterium]